MVGNSLRGMIVVMIAACVPSEPADDATDFSAVFDGRAGQWVDLSHAFSDETIHWPTAPRFELREEAYGDTEAGYFYASYTFSAAEHGGTHLDAPIHFARDRWTTDEIPLSRLIGPAVVVDVSAKATPDYRVTIEDFQAWEARNGTIPAGSIVLVRTGWSERWPDAEAYLGTANTGPEAVPELHFPGLHPDAAQWLVDERDPAAIGIDTASIDYGQSSLYEAHVILYSAQIPGFENVARMETLPETGAFVVALPMKIAGGSGGPLRIVAFIPD